MRHRARSSSREAESRVPRASCDASGHGKGGAAMKWGGVVLMASGCVLVAFLSGVAAKHTSATAWMARYRNAEGTSCCGATDCRAAQVSLVRQTPRETTVRINGVEVVLPTM